MISVRKRQYPSGIDRIRCLRRCLRQLTFVKCDECWGYLRAATSERNFGPEQLRTRVCLNTHTNQVRRLLLKIHLAVDLSAFPIRNRYRINSVELPKLRFW